MHDGKLYGVRPRQVSRADTLWRKLFSVKGESPEPIPVLDVGNEPIEQQFLNGWRCYTDSIGVTGDATHKGQIIIQFPILVDPMIAVLTRLEVFYTPATIGNPIKLGWGIYSSITGNAGKPRDGRLTPAANTGQLRNQTFNAVADLFSVAIDVYPVSQTAAVSVHQPVLVDGEQLVIHTGIAGGTGSRLVIATFANAETLQVRYAWKERGLEPSELQST